MFLNMWGEPLVFSYQPKPPATLIYKSAQPTLVSEFTHESLSNLSCEKQIQSEGRTKHELTS